VLVRNEKYPDHAQHRDDPDEFIPADVIADNQRPTGLVSTVAAVEP